MNVHATCLGIVAALAACCTASTAAAESCKGCGPHGYGYHRNLYSREHIPYFSLHPPVYYSYPVPRPYGWSPFAYPPGTKTPSVKCVPVIEPEVIPNPHVEQPAPAAPAGESMARTQPLLIHNPYYVAETPSSAAARTAAANTTRDTLPAVQSPSRQ